MTSPIAVMVLLLALAALVWWFYGPLLAVAFVGWSIAMYLVGLYQGTMIMTGGEHRAQPRT